MYTIPTTPVKQWDDLKNKSLKEIDAIAGPTVSPAEKKQMRKVLGDLFDTFDKGLKAQMKTAAAAKTDQESRAGAAKIIAIVKDYGAKIDASAAKYKDPNADTVRRNVRKKLDEIRVHAEASLKSKAPVALPKEIGAGWAAVQKRVENALPRLEADDADKRELENKVLQVVAVAVNSAQKVVAEPQAKTAVTNLVAKIETAMAALRTWNAADPGPRAAVTREVAEGLKPLYAAAKATAAKF